MIPRIALAGRGWAPTNSTHYNSTVQEEYEQPAQALNEFLRVRARRALHLLFDQYAFFRLLARVGYSEWLFHQSQNEVLA